MRSGGAAFAAAERQFFAQRRCARRRRRLTFEKYGGSWTSLNAIPAPHSAGLSSGMRLSDLAVCEKSAVQYVTSCPARENAEAMRKYLMGRDPSAGRLSNGLTIQTFTSALIIA